MLNFDNVYDQLIEAGVEARKAAVLAYKLVKESESYTPPYRNPWPAPYTSPPQPYPNPFWSITPSTTTLCQSDGTSGLKVRDYPSSSFLATEEYATLK